MSWCDCSKLSEVLAGAHMIHDDSGYIIKTINFAINTIRNAKSCFINLKTWYLQMIPQFPLQHILQDSAFSNKWLIYTNNIYQTKSTSPYSSIHSSDSWHQSPSWRLRKPPKYLARLNASHQHWRYGLENGGNLAVFFEICWWVDWLMNVLRVWRISFLGIICAWIKDTWKTTMIDAYIQHMYSTFYT